MRTYRNARQLEKTSNLERVIYRFGQMSIYQAKYFLPPFTRAGEDPVPVTDADALKVLKQLELQRTIKIKGDVAYVFVTENRTPLNYDQRIIDEIWFLLNFAYSNGCEKDAWDLIDDVITEKAGAVKMRFILDHSNIINVIPVYSETDIPALLLATKNRDALIDNEKTGVKETFVVMARDNNSLTRAVQVIPKDFPISNYVLIEGDNLTEPTGIKYLKTR